MIERFEANRPRLRAIAYRMLGSTAEADDAVQEAWLRLHRTADDAIDNLDAWLTTVVGRVCLDMLRSRTARREDTIPDATPLADGAHTPEQQAVLADSVGLALFVVLETLTPAERLAFVLHDLFAVPFDEIAPIVGRTPDAARQLASRARRRVRNQDADRPADRHLVDAFLAASRHGDLTTLLSLLDPDVRMRVDEAATRLGAPAEMTGSTVVAQFFAGRAQAATQALIDGVPGIWIAPVQLAVLVTVANGRITTLHAVADPDHLRTLEIVPTS
jgi:RNA polymerase sigma-70 factor (ECF subfamily)